ncbi:MAG TPA: hypothetical protein VNE39_04285 [Planctomycetota bacterium]|nr:hypothetical protein [Planctomycetota bacterium]
MPEEYRAEALQCSLQVAIAARNAEMLGLTYTFENGASRNAYLFNLLYKHIEPGPIFVTDANAVYVELAGEDLVLSKKIIPVPRHMDVEKPNVPCTTLVKPGERFQGDVLIPLPLQVNTPYEGYEDADLAPRPVLRKASFEIGFFLASPEGEALGEKVRTMAGEATYFYPFSPSSQKLLRVGPFSEAVPVRVPRE